MKVRIVTAEEIIRGASRRRPKISFPGLSRELNAQATEMVRKHSHVRRGASPFVHQLLSKTRRTGS